MIQIQVEIDINYPCDKTFEFISNFENNALWQSGIESFKWISSPGFKIGTQYEHKANFVGKEIIAKFKVVGYIPGKMIKTKSFDGAFPLTHIKTVEGNDTVSHVHAVIEGESKGAFKISETLLKIMVNRTIKKDYKKLKEILEKKK